MRPLALGKKFIIVLVIAFTLMTSATATVLNQNEFLTKTNAELLRTNNELQERYGSSYEDLLLQLENASSELEAIRRNYSRLLNFFGANSEPKIQTQLGATLIEPYQNKDENYLWVTGKVENTENVTVYDVRLKFTIFTNNGVDVKEDLIGTMQPYQVVDRRFSVLTSMGKITNWSIEIESTFIPIDY
jgi:hypothetical protein